MGGTCAVDLTVMHPEMFSSFVDIAGDLSPNSGTKAQTIARLFGGDAEAWSTFDPTTVITKHGPYNGVSGWFAINGTQASNTRRSIATSTSAMPGLGGRDGTGNPGDQTTAANSLCALGAANGIDVRGGRATRQARLAVRRTGVRRGTAVAGRRDRHPR